ncbi:MAG: hypothetical protein JXM79_16555 [Sedimentisphaerales bacterium]|nr:hypothetical protein [Sedimentisphaerales bacterium]
MKKRCDWPGDNKLMIEYHDTEFGLSRTCQTRPTRPTSDTSDKSDVSDFSKARQYLFYLERTAAFVYISTQRAGVARQKRMRTDTV